MIAFISEISRNSAKDEQKITNFYEEVSEANFLFGKLPNQQIGRIYDKAFDLYELEAIFEALQATPPGDRSPEENEECKDILRKRSELKKWFIKQSNITVDIFKKELFLVVFRDVINLRGISAMRG